jgi:hypothetical protein
VETPVLTPPLPTNRHLPHTAFVDCDILQRPIPGALDVVVSTVAWHGKDHDGLPGGALGVEVKVYRADPGQVALAGAHGNPFRTTPGRLMTLNHHFRFGLQPGAYEVEALVSGSRPDRPVHAVRRIRLEVD